MMPGTVASFVHAVRNVTPNHGLARAKRAFQSEEGYIAGFHQVLDAAHIAHFTQAEMETIMDVQTNRNKCPPYQ